MFSTQVLLHAWIPSSNASASVHALLLSSSMPTAMYLMRPPSCTLLGIEGSIALSGCWPLSDCLSGSCASTCCIGQQPGCGREAELCTAPP